MTVANKFYYSSDVCVDSILIKCPFHQNESEVWSAAGQRDRSELPVGRDRGGEAAGRHRHRNPP